MISVKVRSSCYLAPDVDRFPRPSIVIPFRFVAGSFKFVWVGE